VDDYGRFTNEVPELSGQNIYDANKTILDILGKNNSLISSISIEHSYPHCWRCKKPVIFRATSQWFISMEKKNLRADALSAINQVKWIPSWGKERIYGMVESRPDWCISRQRAWGVPVTIFTCRNCNTPLLNQEMADRIVSVFQKDGADAWFSAPADDFLPPGAVCGNCGSKSFKREKDILDVWFDSGASFAAVLENRNGLSYPADLYLEGSDQHRGWFQSSLLISTATRHQAPYHTVLTHGFVVDQKGRKMSKSEGNVIPPSDIIKQHGAEILRLWVSAEDYHDDIKISREILQRLTEAYRKIRNTIRYLLSNISGFNPELDSLSFEEMEPIDRWALSRLEDLTENVIATYKAFKFHKVFHQVNQFCTVDMSAVYLDILKDRLYCELPKGRLRRSAQTVIYKIAHDLIILLAPILSFTSEEAWKFLPKMEQDNEKSVFLSSFPEPSGYKISKDEEEEWKLLWKIRAEITKALEIARKEQVIGLALDAKVIITPPEALKDIVSSHLDLIKQISIVSQMEISDSSPAGEGMQFKGEEIQSLFLTVLPASGEKCGRCWTWSEDVGASSEWPDACGRCVKVLKELKSEAESNSTPSD
jgi:isoleucyl-tRNA synthetase